MAYNCENIRFGSFDEPISATSDRSDKGYVMAGTFNTLQNNFVHGVTFENPSPNLVFGSFSENYMIPNQSPVSATSDHTQSPSLDIALRSFSAGQHDNMGCNAPFATSHRLHAWSSDLAITPCLQQNNVGSIGRLITHAGLDNFPITYPQIEQNNHPSDGSQKIRAGKNRTKSTGRRKGHGNTSNSSRKRSRSSDMVSGPSSGSQCKKRIHFRFGIWTYEEQVIMAQELEKCSPSPILEACKWIAILLPKKSIRDVAMYIKSLINHGKVEDIWDWDDYSPRTDLRDYGFYLPDNPNDPDLVKIRKMLSAPAVEGSRG